MVDLHLCLNLNSIRNSLKNLNNNITALLEIDEIKGGQIPKEVRHIINDTQ